MDYNQTNSSNATFKMPLVPQAQYLPSQPETLLFNDIMEEKTLALRSTLSDFLQVHSYRKFDTEFSNFLKHTRRLIIEGQRTGANISRLNNSQMSTIYSRPSGFNCRPSTAMSMISSNRNSTYQMSESDYLHIEPRNPFKPPNTAQLQPKVVLPRLEQTNYMSNSFRSPTSNATVIQVCQVTNGTTNADNFNKNVNPPLSIEKSQSTVPNSYSEVTIIDNDESMHVTDSQHNETVNEDNSIESLLENVGFKIVLGLPDNGKTTNSINARQHQDKNQTSKSNSEKYLSMWSINLKKPQIKSSKVNLILTGTLLSEDQKTVLEKNHDAGILESRKDNSKDLVQTKNGVYRLVGGIVSGTPTEFYRACLAIGGIPRTWRSIIKPCSGVEKNTKKLMLDFSLDSPAGPIQTTKKVVNLDMSMTKKGTVYTSLASKNTTNGKRKYSEYVTENSKVKHSKFHENLPPLLASTPKRPKTQSTMFQTPSQYLKTKIHQNIRNQTSNDTPHRSLKNINDSINVTKKRQSCSKEQTNLLSKSKTPLIKTSLSSKNSTKCSNQPSNNSTSLGSVNSTKQSKQTSKSDVNIRNSTDCSTQSKNKVSGNASTMKNSLNSTKQKSQSKLSINNDSTKSSINNSKQILKSSVKTVKQMKQKENVTNKVSPASKTRNNQENNKCTKVKQNNKKLKDAAVEEKKRPKGRPRKVKLDENRIEMTPVKLPNKISGDLCLFDDVDAADLGDISDFNILASPGKFSFVSRTDESRSETPPLFGHQWSTTGKSLAHSEPPTPLSKSVEGKALKRVKAPKITLQEELKNQKAQTKKPSIDYKTAAMKIDKMLEFGESYDEDDE